MSKRNKTILIISLPLLLLTIVFFVWYTISINKTELYEFNSNINLKSNMFAIMLEQEDGKYTEYDKNTWPSKEEYIFDNSLSGCFDNDGEVVEDVLSYNDETQIAKVKTTKAVYCYLYFKKNDKILQ